MDSGIQRAWSPHANYLCETCKAWFDRFDHGHDPGRQAHSLTDLQKTGDDYCHSCYVIARGVQALIEKHGWDSSSGELGPLIDSSDDSVTILLGEEGTSRAWDAFFYHDSSRSKNNFFGWPNTTLHHRPCGTTPTTVLQFARQALAQCFEQHDCQLRKEVSLPKRLLDVQSTAVGEDDLRVVESVKVPSPETVRYVALSYCWGEKSVFRDELLKRKRFGLTEMERGLPLSHLPGVYQDAVSTTRYLGFRYLWIDALCIAQGDAEEWKTESLKMAETYSYAVVTIAADAAATCDESFLNTQRYRELSTGIEVPGSGYPGVMPEVFVRIKDDSLYDNNDLYGFPPRASMMETRGWTFQEGLLSRRVLSFRHNYVHFRCLEGIRTEFDHASFQRQAELYHGELNQISSFDPNFSNESRWRDALRRPAAEPVSAYDLEEIWRLVLSSYTRRELTNAGDRLVAIAGVASTLRSRVTPGNLYLAGLWKDCFVKELLWISHVSTSWDGQKDSLSNVPSWSWASVTGSISIKDEPWQLWQPWPDLQWHTELVQSPSSCDDFDGTKCGPAVVEGPFVDAIIEQDSVTLTDLKTAVRIYPGSIIWDTPLEAVPTLCKSAMTLQRARFRNKAWTSRSGTRACIHLLLIYSGNNAHFLLLTKTTETEEQYSRIGIWTMGAHDERKPKRWPTSVPRHVNALCREFVTNLPRRRISLV
ncbi:hypothetical protein PV11_00697 [Exophiala sideris]|uniref:Heterokaryon incompatibility domain-containing protein n=1 Tax=Exophiala sideris TaxID=1016849 RepID=A0A0D1YQC5_9EURO|nr:hypothetical protein PV11_00697 [Exophiala sideris]